MKKINNKKNISYTKIFSSIFMTGVILSMTSCFEDEKELFFETTVASFSDNGVDGSTEVEFSNVSALVEGDEGVAGSASYSWDFGNDNATDDVSTDENPTYVYPDEGDYIVSFIVTDADGAVSSSTRTITVDDEIDTESIFSFEQSGSGSFNFVNESTDAEQFSWDLGNGVISTDEEPSVVYDALGDYDVVLSVVSSHGEESESSETISIGAALATQTEAEAAVGEALANKVLFSNISIGMDEGYTVEIIDTETGTLVDTLTAVTNDEVLEYIFTEGGSFMATLTSTFNSIPDTTSVSIAVNESIELEIK